MEIEITNRFKRSYQALSMEERKAFKKQIELLISHPSPPFYPSLRIKKIKGVSGIFECSINKDIRMTCQYVRPNIILLRNIGKHDRTLSDP
jgi:mRNA interferase RelE/StbE